MKKLWIDIPTPQLLVFVGLCMLMGIYLRGLHIALRNILGGFRLRSPSYAYGSNHIYLSYFLVLSGFTLLDYIYASYLGDYVWEVPKVLEEDVKNHIITPRRWCSIPLRSLTPIKVFIGGWDNFLSSPLLVKFHGESILSRTLDFRRFFYSWFSCWIS